MARADDDDDPVGDGAGGRGRAAARQVRASGHSTSGGHAQTLPGRANKAMIDHHHRHQPEERPLEYHEYPKCVGYEADGKTMIVARSREEETDLLAAIEPGADPADRQRLVDLAQASGVMIDKRWGAAKLQAALESAGIDPAVR